MRFRTLFHPLRQLMVLTLLVLQGASPFNMKDRLAQLDLLSLRYGANAMTINGREALIVKGAYETGTAWGGDEYSVLVKEGEKWQLARHQEGAWESTITADVPHTGEDSVVSIRFMVPKGQARSANVSDLYLLKAERHYETSPADPVPVIFALYLLARENDDLGVRYFRPVGTEMSRARYCSADLALHRELGLALPLRSQDERTYACP
jgi:hypothetical protein